MSNPFKRIYLTYIFYVFVVVFLVYYFSALDYESIARSGFDPIIFLGSIVIGVLGIAWGAVMWMYLLSNLGAEGFNRTQMFYVYSKAWLGRYIPGTAPWILGKIGFASRHGISKKKLATSSLLEAMLQLISTFIVSFLLILFSRNSIELPAALWAIVLLGFASLITIVHPSVFNKITSFIFAKIKKTEPDKSLHTSLSLNIKGVTFYSIGTLLLGFSLFLVARSVVDIELSDIPFVMGSSTLSGAIGMIVIFVPSGIGVREVSQTALLSTIMSTEQALLVAVLSRLWSVIVDILFFLIMLVFKKVNT